MQLSDENIENSVEDIRQLFENSAVSPDDCVRICLLVEEALLRFQQHFGKEHGIHVKSQKWFGVPKVIIRLKGAPFDPFQADEYDDDDDILSVDVMNSLFRYDHAKTVYAYKNGYNEVSTYATKAQKTVKIPGGIITKAILLAIICAAITGFLPPYWQTVATKDIADPLLKSLMGLIVALTGPFVFVSVVSGICIMDDVTTLNTVGVRVIRRFFVIMLMMSVLAAGVCQMFFPVLALSSEGSFEPVKFFKMLLDTLPNNLVTPFANGNVLQIVFIAILTGVAVLILNNVVPNLKIFIGEVNKLIFKMMDIVSKVIYIAIFLNVYQMIVGNSLDSILNVWKIVLANYVFCIGFGLIMVLRVAYKHKINVPDFFRRGSKVFIISLSTASNTAAMSTNVNFVKNDLHIDEKFCDFWLPLSHAVFSPSAAAALVAGVFYASDFSGVPLSFFSLIVTLILSLQLSIATPPVPGGIMAIYAIVLTQLGLPLDSIGMLMIAAVFVVNISSLMSMIIRDCELIDISYELKKQQGIPKTP